MNTSRTTRAAEIIDGDILDVDVDVLVNPWNRNLFPWWLLVPQGVSGAIKRRAGLEPFRELARMPMIPLGHAVITGPGKLLCNAIIHVAGINLAWRASASSVQNSVRSAISLAEVHGFASLALPLIGAGSGGMNAAASERLIFAALAGRPTALRVSLVRYAATPK